MKMFGIFYVLIIYCLLIFYFVGGFFRVIGLNTFINLDNYYIIFFVNLILFFFFPTSTRGLGYPIYLILSDMEKYYTRGLVALYCKNIHTKVNEYGKIENNLFTLFQQVNIMAKITTNEGTSS